MSHNLTLVTALFDIGRGELKEGFRRSFQHYVECFERLLKVDYPMVIFCEESLAEAIWKVRSPENTKLVFRTLDDLRRFPFYDKVQTIRTDSEWIHRSGWIEDSTQAKLELYNPLVMSKQFMLHDASLFNFFDSKYYLWVDAGIANTIGEPSNYFDEQFATKIIPDLNKMLYIAFPYDGTVEVHGYEKGAMDRMAGKPTEYVCRGGIFGGPKHSLSEVNDIYYQLLHSSFQQGLMGTEESIFTILSYKYPEKVNVRMIESNGLVYKYLEEVKKRPLEECSDPLALYFLTFNTPKQFSLMIDAFKKAYPVEFKASKKYVVDNSNDARAMREYRKIFNEHEISVIHENENLGIQDGRQLVAEHFDASAHKYYIFFEEDFFLIDKESPSQNKNGFIRYTPELFQKGIDILESHSLDYLKLSIIEFYGDCTQDWAFKNVPEDKRKMYYPERPDGNAELRWKTQIDYLGFHGDLAFGVGHFHVDNWPHIISKKGNRQMYLAEPYAHKFEQTIMSQCKTYLIEGKLRGGCLLAAPIEHNRTYHYDGKKRRENRHYTN